MKTPLRITGVLATVVFLVMVVSDLLMLTTLDFSRPYRFWRDAPGLPQAQVVVGYYLGELTVPYLVVLGLILLGRTLYPRWAGLALPAVFAAAAFLLGPYVPVWANVILGSAGWNVGGAATLGVSTVLLWNRGS